TAAAARPAAARRGATRGGGSSHTSLRGRLAEHEVGHRLARGIVAVVHLRAVDPDLLGPGVDAERIAVPQHHIAHLAWLQGAGDAVHAQGAGGVAGEPGDRALGRDLDPGAARAGDHLGRLLVEPLDALVR